MSAGSASASVTDDVVASLVNDGFKQVTIRRTLLGRVHIVAVSEDETREIVLDPRNGSILRDYSEPSLPIVRSSAEPKPSAVSIDNTPEAAEDGDDGGSKDETEQSTAGASGSTSSGETGTSPEAPEDDGGASSDPNASQSDKGKNSEKGNNGNNGKGRGNSDKRSGKSGR
ncbi:hypothetical protein [Celeribacter litoreus]|uniref:hypothetical protein n=1 Tax=Celeribacter litoreus TaxID=2876714 RepID=UPI001CCCD2A3|nr:hypothetical protein [Celeribacter litoreus]